MKRSFTSLKFLIASEERETGFSVVSGVLSVGSGRRRARRQTFFHILLLSFHVMLPLDTIPIVPFQSVT